MAENSDELALIDVASSPIHRKTLTTTEFSIQTDRLAEQEIKIKQNMIEKLQLKIQNLEGKLEQKEDSRNASMRVDTRIQNQSTGNTAPAGSFGPIFSQRRKSNDPYEYTFKSEKSPPIITPGIHQIPTPNIAKIYEMENRINQLERKFTRIESRMTNFEESIINKVKEFEKKQTLSMKRSDFSEFLTQKFGRYESLLRESDNKFQCLIDRDRLCFNSQLANIVTTMEDIGGLVHNLRRESGGMSANMDKVEYDNIMGLKMLSEINIKLKNNEWMHQDLAMLKRRQIEIIGILKQEGLESGDEIHDELVQEEDEVEDPSQIPDSHGGDNIDTDIQRETQSFLLHLEHQTGL